MTSLNQILFSFSPLDKFEQRTSAIGTEIQREFQNLNRSIQDGTLAIQNKLNELNSTMSQNSSDSDINRPEASFIFEVQNVTDFLEGKGAIAEFFYCRGIRFWFQVKNLRSEFQPEALLSIILRTSFSPLDIEYNEYSLNTCIELRLLNFQNKTDKVVKTEYKYGKKMSPNKIIQNLATTKELTDPQNGFVQANTFKIQVNLKCDKLKRV